MKEFLLKHQGKALALVLCLVPLILLATSAGASVGKERRIRPTRWSWSFLSLGQVGLTESVSEVFSIFDDDDTEKELARLRAENAILREEKARLIGVLQENERLRKMVGFKQSHPEYTLVPARVISQDTSPFFRVISIEIKAPEGVKLKVRQPVLVAGGVVGQVHEVLDGHAQVLLLSDPRSQIDVISQRNRAHGIVSGLGHERDYEAKVSYLSEKDQVREGDVMVTSGMGGGFPPELIVGEVLSVQPDERGLFQKVTVAPAVDLSRVSEVFVLTATKERMMTIEQEEDAAALEEDDDAEQQP